MTADSPSAPLSTAPKRSRIVIPVKIEREHDLERFLLANPGALGRLMVIGVEIGRVDILCIDASGRIYIVELKRGHAIAAAAGQLLSYYLMVREWSPQRIIEWADAGDPGSFAARFEHCFGRPLPANINHSHVLVLVARSFRDDLLTTLDWMHTHAAPVHVIGFTDTTREPMQPIRHSGIDTTTPLVVAARAFWSHFESRFTWRTVPASFIYVLYERWSAAEREAGRPAPIECICQLTAAIDEVTWEYKHWRHTHVRRAEWEPDTAEPLVSLAPDWRRPLMRCPHEPGSIEEVFRVSRGAGAHRVPGAEPARTDLPLKA